MVKPNIDAAPVLVPNARRRGVCRVAGKTVLDTIKTDFTSFKCDVSQGEKDDATYPRK
jgi:hypothetical protein